MTDAPDFALRDAAALLGSGIQELESRAALLEIALESEKRTNAILLDTVSKLSADLEKATVANKRLFAENARIVRTLTGAGNLIKDGVAEINAARTVPLRGSPQRNEETAPNVVRMG